MPKKKHPKDMTSDELMKHLFHPKVVKHIKKVVAGKKKSMKKA
jgi:hypothetical protein